jgi:nicotinamidase-related amidase
VEVALLGICRGSERRATLYKPSLPIGREMTEILGREKVLFVVVDIQDTLLKKCYEWEKVQERTVVFLQFCHVVNMPIVMTEQYPKGLGRTNLAIAEAAGVDPIPKTTFNCFGEPAFEKAIEEHGPETIILSGIEAHVCILQTALDALERGYKVHVLEDAVSSRADWMASNALTRLSRAGVVVSNTESAMFEVVGDSSDPMFKRMLFLVK